MSQLDITTRIPQSTDSERMLLARMLKTSGSGYALARALRSVSTYSSDISTEGFSTLIYRLNIVSFGGGTGVIPMVRAVDPQSGVATTLATASAALTGTGWWVYAIGRGIGTFSGMGTGLQGYASLPLSSLIQVGLHWTSLNWHEVEVTYELVP